MAALGMAPKFQVQSVNDNAANYRRDCGLANLAG